MTLIRLVLLGGAGSHITSDQMYAADGEYGSFGISPRLPS